MKFCRSPVGKRIILCVVMLALLMSGVVAFPTQLRAEETNLTNSNITSTNVQIVKTLADNLITQNPTINNKGNETNITWDTEGKNRSWTYYNGIMMDAYMMLFEGNSTYEDYVKKFYENNIDNPATKENIRPANSRTSDYKDNGPIKSVKATDNYYRENELDSVPPTRALFDLIRKGIGTTSNYKMVIDYVYSVLNNYETLNFTYSYNNVDYSGKIQKHKYNHSVYGTVSESWNNRPIALDGIYMAQPFFMELANALDNPATSKINVSTDFANYSNVTSIDTDALYTDVYKRMMWIRDIFLDSDTGLYHHGWGSSLGTNNTYWLRAIGWYAAALADVIDMMPDRFSTYRDDLIEVAKQMFDGMIDGTYDDGTHYQDATTGMWRNIVNKKRTDVYNSTTKYYNELESSGSALMAYAMLRLYATNRISENKYAESGLKAFNGIANYYVKKGLAEDDYYHLYNVYRSAGVEASDSEYLKGSFCFLNSNGTPNGEKPDEAKGVGPLMMAAAYANAAASRYNNPAIVTDPVANTLTYTGEDQELTTTGSVTGGTLYYGLGGADSEPEEWTTEVPKGNEIGTYYVWYKVIGDSEHSGKEPT